MDGARDQTINHGSEAEVEPAEGQSAPGPQASAVKRRIRRILATVLFTPLILVTCAWGALAIYFAGPPGDVFRIGLMATFVALGLGAQFALATWRWKRNFLPAYSLAFGLLLLWWWSLEPSNDRDWVPESVLLPSATIEGDLVRVRNVRNLKYRTAQDFELAYYDKTFELSKLESVDLIASYWMGPAIAHVFVSFGFEGGDQLAVSIETRKEKGEAYSTLKGFFKQYELIYVVADERDVIGVRTNFRKDPPEDVYLFPVDAPIENLRRFFIEYVTKINSLEDTPQFYDTLRTNCTSSIWLHSQVNPGHIAYSWKLLLSGYLPEYLYEQGRLAGDLSFDELKQRAHVNARAMEADDAEDFSRRIRLKP